MNALYIFLIPTNKNVRLANVNSEFYQIFNEETVSILYKFF